MTRRRWSKLQKQLYNLFTHEINLQIHCTVYTIDFHLIFESPRHWITLDKEIIWDFPSYFFEWIHPEVPKPISTMEEGHGLGGISDLFRQYINTPKNQLITRNFMDDHWGGVINIFRAADRRLGKKKLLMLKENLRSSEPAMKVLLKRLGKREKTNMDKV